MALSLKSTLRIFSPSAHYVYRLNFSGLKKSNFLSNTKMVVMSAPNRMCSFEEKVKNKQKIKQIKTPSTGVPKVITRLLVRSNHDPQGPALSRLTRLARAFGQAKFKVNDIEAALIQQLISKADREGETNSQSISTLRTFLTNNLGSTERNDSMKMFFSILEDSRIVDQSLPADDQKIQSKKIDFLCSLLRFANICENVVMHFDKTELQQIDEFVRSCITKLNTHSPLIMFWMSLFQKESAESLDYASKLAQEFPEIRRHLVEDIEQFADEYNKFIDDTPNHLLFQSIPKPFIIGNIPSFVDKLSVTRIIDSDEFIYTLICLKARALWNAEKFSKSLPTLAVACQFWLANVESRNDLDQLGLHVLLTMSEYIEFSIENDYEASIKFFKVFGEKMESVNPVPVVKFFLYIFGQKKEKYREESVSLLEQYPVIRKMWDKKLEKKLLDPSSTLEEKKAVLLQMAKRIPERARYIRSQQEIVSESNKTTNIENENFSDQVVRDMLDIKVLSFIKDEKIQSVVETIQRASTNGRFPSDEVLLMLTQHLFKMKDISTLKKLRTYLPVKNDVSDRVFGYELTIKLQDLHQKWENGERSEIPLEVTSLYKETLEEDFRIQFEFLETLLTKTRRYIRFFLESVLENDDLILLAQFEKISKEMARVYEDFSILALCWEATFFSKNHLTKSREILNENPKLPHHLDIDSALIQAQRLSDESKFREILEITLRYDLELYQKCKAVESLLLFQCKNRDKRGADATLKFATDQNMELNPEIVKLYHVLPVNRFLFGKIPALFSKTQNPESK